MDYPIGADLKMAIAPLAAHELVKMQGISNGELFAWNVRPTGEHEVRIHPGIHLQRR
jgi:hypothetical protein